MSSHSRRGVRSTTRRRSTLAVAVAAALGASLGVPTPAGADSHLADLSVSVGHSPSAAMTGDDVTFTVTASNAGPAASVDVVVGLSLGYAWNYQSSSGGTCGVGGENQAVICTVGTIAPGASATVTVEAQPVTSGVFVVPVAVASETPDPDSDDRSASETVIVQRGPSQAERAIGEVYGQVLGRSPSAAEIAFWAERWEMQEWNQRYRVPLSIIASPESGRRRIQASYTALLGRSATPGDLAFWSVELTRGRPFEAFEAAVLGSPEFARRNGPDARAVVQAVFAGVLGRSATVAELDATVARMAGGATVAEVATGLQRTTEARNRVIVLRVQQVLERPPSDFDRFVWLSELNAGSTNDAQWAALYAGNEFLNQFPYDYEYYEFGYPVMD